MSDHLDDRLRALGASPVPVPPVDGAVRRGQQRRRRARALSASAVVVALLAGGLVVRDLTAGGEDALQFAPPPPPTSSPSPAADPTVGAAAGLLTARDAERIAGGTWTEGPVDGEASFVRLQICPTKDVGGRAGVARQLEQESVVVDSQVVDFGAASDGAPVQPVGEQVLQALREDVRACPQRPEGPEGGTSAFALLAVQDQNDVVVRWTKQDCPDCPDRVRYVVAVAEEQLVSYTVLPEPQRERLDLWATVAGDRLRCAVLTCPTPAPEPAQTSPAPESSQASPAPSPAGLQADDPLRYDGIGPVRIGMTLAQAERAAKQPLTEFRDDLGNGCGFVEPRSQRPDISFMVDDDRITLVYVEQTSRTRTDRGIGTGSTEAQVRAAYPDVVQTPHAYTDGSYLTATSEDGRYAIVFETDGARVTLIRGGDERSKGQVEGCA